MVACGMIEVVKIFDIFRSQPLSTESSTAAQTETVRKIVDALERFEPDRARYLAAFAYILSRVARADLKISPEETRAMEQIVVEYGGVSEDQAILVVQIARHQNLLFGGTENFLVTREFNKIATFEQKLALLDCLFRVAAAEDLISTVEDNEIRQVASELGLSHEDFIAIRSTHRDQLGVFRRDES
jgi:uncharacterized tellurite resistance protein B-like protein